MKKATVYIIVLCTCFGMLRVLAQDKKKKTVPVPPKTNKVSQADTTSTQTNEEIIANIDSMSSSGDDSLMYFITDSSTKVRYFLFPEFYSYWPITKTDTVIRYICYDAENSFINIDTLHNIDDVKHIHFVKVYSNLLHTYIDIEGKPRASSATKTIYRYDKTDDNSWKSYDVSSNYIAELKEYKNEIVRQDTTTLLNPITKGKQLTIRKYYRVIELKHKGEIETDK